MVVFCPGCGAKISVATDPADPAGKSVECPKCHSRFSTAGVKPTADGPPPKKLRKKKPGSRLTGCLILLLVVLVLGGGTAAVLYFTGYLDRFTGRPPSVKTGPGPATAQPAWQEYVNQEGKFRVLFPGTPTREVITPPGRSKAAARPLAVVFTVDTPDVIYSVAFQDFDPSGKVGGSPEQFIQRQHEELTSGRSGKLVSEKDVTAGANKGKDFVVEAPGGGTVHMRFLAAGRRMYKLSALGRHGPPPAGDVSKFFDSFQVIE